MVGHGRGALSTTDRLDVGAFLPAVTQPWIPVFTGKTMWGLTGLFSYQ